MICLTVLLALMILIVPVAGADSGLSVEPYAPENSVVGSAAADVLFDDTVTLTEGTFTCTASSGSAYTVDRLTPLGALDAVADAEGFTYVVGDKKKLSNGFLLLDNVSDYVYVKGGDSWYYMVNGDPLDGFADASEGVDVYGLVDGDEVVFYYGGNGVTPENATALINITVSVNEGMDVLYDGTVTLEDGTFTCTASSGAEYTVNTLTPLGALDAVADAEGFLYIVNNKSYDSKGILLIDGIGEHLFDKAAGTTWVCYVNDVALDDWNSPATDGLNLYTLEEGDEVEFYFGTKPVAPETATAMVGITIEVAEPESWTLSLKGALTDTIDQAYFEDAVDCGHVATYTDGDGNVWSGVPLWYLAGWVDDDQKHGAGAFNDDLAAEGYSIKVTAGDGYSVNFESASVARDNAIIVANTLNGEPLPAVIGEKEKPCWPLQMIGEHVTSGQKVGNVVEIELVGLPEPSDGWTITLNGKFSRTLTQEEFEEGIACGHAAAYTDSSDRVWTGMPLWYLVGVVDDIETSNHWTFDDTLAAGGYTINVTAEDGYTVTLNSADIAESDAYIVANKLNATPLGNDDGYPLKLQGSALTSGKQRVGNIASITLVDLPGSPEEGEWTLTLEGPAITAVISQTEFEEGAACHSATYNDGVSTWTGVPLWYLAGWVDDDVMHGSGAFNDNLASTGYTVIVSSGGVSPYSKEFTSQEIVANKNQYIVANKVNGSAITGTAFPLRLVGEGAPGSKSVGNIEKIALTAFQEPTDLPSVRIIRYAADGKTILNQTEKTYRWMEENLPVIGGADGVRLRYQGPTFDPNDLWNPAEDKNPGKVDNVVRGTSIADLCDLVGGAPEGSEIVLIASDNYEAKLNYTNIYTPLDRQGEAILAWWADDEYVPDYRDGIRLFFNAPDGIFGADDMRACLAEDYWHYYWSGGIQYPSAAGIANKNIVTVEIHPGAREDWNLILSGAITDTITRSYFEAGKACALGGHGATYTDADGNEWSGMPLWLLVGWVDDTNKHDYGTNPFNETLADIGYNVVVIDYGPDNVKGTDDDFSATFASSLIKLNNNIIVANEIDGAPLPADGDKPSWPLKLVGSALTSNKQKVGSIDEIALIDLPVPADAELSLEQGWNFISIPKRLASGHNTAAIFSGVDTANHSIWQYNAAIKYWEEVQTTDTLRPLAAYWVYSAAACNVSLIFSDEPLQTPPTGNLYKGWNAIGFTDTEPAAARDTLLSLGDIWTQVLGFDAGNQEYETAIIRGGSGSHADTGAMLPGKGYWVYLRGSGELAAIAS
ncbi:DUF4430 domain-containing protein [Methanoculleus taiwanensis]|uniref:DUF4430 domain-containing protein n=1 Tax=Methanoculleus taiwanensis TaxID=1550565 RepID=UPI0013E89961|nr:DUF4430 domain-containing protein [Methanoculleus taiwanensis]